MVTVSGRLLDFVEDPSNVAQVRVRAREVRPHGDGVMLDHPVKVDWDPSTGTVTFDAAAGTAGVIMWHAVGRSHASGSLPIVVPDGDTATLRECVEAALLADEGTITALERLALEITGYAAELGNATQLKEWATTAETSATRAQSIAAGLPTTIQTELDTRVPPEVADALAADQTIRDAATLAVNDAVDAGLPGKADTTYVDEQDQTLEQRIEEINVAYAEDVAGTEWAHVTEQGDRLPLGYTSDGTLDPHARQVWSEQVNDTHLTALDNRYAYVMATDEGHLLMAFRPDGTVVAPGLKTPQGVSSGDQIIGPDGTITPAIADVRHIYAWGSSSMNRLANNLDPMVTQWGTTYHNQAQPGETIQHIAARMGAIPAIIDPVTIPESGGVAVTSSNYPVSGQIRTFSGTLAGVPGTLGWSGGAVTFTRSETGPAVQVTEPTPFIPTPDPQARRSVTIISAGKNNMSDPDGVQTVLDATDAMVDYLTPMIKRVVVMGHFQNRDWTPASPEWGRVEEVNGVLSERYGAWFFDHAAALASPEIWGLAGVTPTADDLTAQEIGRLPPSLSSDHQHQNENADIAVGKLLLRHLAHLGWA